MMSMCRVISCVVGRGCSLWRWCSLGKTLLAFALLHFLRQGQTCLLLQVTHDFLLLHSNPLLWKGHFLGGMSVLEGLVDLNRTCQPQLLQHEWLGHRPRILWYWNVCLENALKSFSHFWDCTQVLLFGLLLTMRATPFLLRDFCTQY